MSISVINSRMEYKKNCPNLGDCLKIDHMFKIKTLSKKIIII